MFKFFNKFNKTRNKKGFTLVEITVVVLIIAILAAIALPKYNVAVEKAKIIPNIVLLKGISDSVLQYYSTYGEFPKRLGELTTTVPKGEYRTTDLSAVKNDFSCSLTVYKEEAQPRTEMACNLNNPSQTRTPEWKMVVYYGYSGDNLIEKSRTFEILNTTPAGRKETLAAVANTAGWIPSGVSDIYNIS
ncbi:MAG: prepilin-type N-terminal cleavage/methylation domain-containing protein [Elusimicrobiota bacterium]|jgi:prepilin-type N-terminal cleavage/methylation domain-containing protein|nr:prepilin-type N-terminal cleavage/methylation domain-containing protein [Elusimicrobiota bacterium]